MREVVVPQIDYGIPGNIREDYRRGHVNADRLQHDDDESEEGPTSAHSQAETRPPRLNGNKKCESCPDNGRKVEFHLGPGQNESAEA
jgi:hypothetical protein